MADGVDLRFPHVIAGYLSPSALHEAQKIAKASGDPSMLTLETLDAFEKKHPNVSFEEKDTIASVRDGLTRALSVRSQLQRNWQTESPIDLARSLIDDGEFFLLPQSVRLQILSFYQGAGSPAAGRFAELIVDVAIVARTDGIVNPDLTELLKTIDGKTWQAFQSVDAAQRIAKLAGSWALGNFIVEQMQSVALANPWNVSETTALDLLKSNLVSKECRSGLLDRLTSNGGLDAYKILHAAVDANTVALSDNDKSLFDAWRERLFADPSVAQKLLSLPPTDAVLVSAYRPILEYLQRKDGASYLTIDAVRNAVENIALAAPPHWQHEIVRVLVENRLATVPFLAALPDDAFNREEVWTQFERALQSSDAHQSSTEAIVALSKLWQLRARRADGDTFLPDARLHKAAEAVVKNFIARPKDDKKFYLYTEKFAPNFEPSSAFWQLLNQVPGDLRLQALRSMQEADCDLGNPPQLDTHSAINWIGVFAQGTKGIDTSKLGLMFNAYKLAPNIAAILVKLPKNQWPVLRSLLTDEQRQTLDQPLPAVPSEDQKNIAALLEM